MLKAIKNPSQKISRTCLPLLTPTQLRIVLALNYNLFAQLKLIILQQVGVYEEYNPTKETYVPVKIEAASFTTATTTLQNLFASDDFEIRTR